MNGEYHTYRLPGGVTICTKFFTGPWLTTWVAWKEGTLDAEQYGETEAEAIGLVFMAMAEKDES